MRKETAAIASGFLLTMRRCVIRFNWKANLAPVLTALHCHPALEIHLVENWWITFRGLSGLESLAT
jgi:hypothetical protein